MDLQKELLQKVIDGFGKKVDAVNELSDFFGVGKDAIYRRLRGDTLLTPDEIYKLVKHYRIPVHHMIFEDLDLVFFSFTPLSRKIKSVDDYLDGLKNNLREFGKVPEATIYFPTNEIPIFYYCFFPELISFKLYVWGRNIWDLEYLQNQPFSTDIISPQALDTCKEVLQSYLKVPVIEMWSLDLFDNTLNQIEYYASSGGFKNERDSLMLCEKLQSLAEHMAKMAESGKKMDLNKPNLEHADFLLYHNEMISTDSYIYLTSPHVRVLFSIFGSPNYMTSSDDRICDFTENWITKIKARSRPISLDAERDRAWFFKGIKKRIESTKNRIQHQLGDFD